MDGLIKMVVFLYISFLYPKVVLQGDRVVPQWFSILQCKRRLVHQKRSVKVRGWMEYVRSQRVIGFSTKNRPSNEPSAVANSKNFIGINMVQKVYKP